jgi:hypothetical protein
MYSHEELEACLTPLKERYSEHGEGFRTLYDYFIFRVRRRLHVVIGMDPSNAGFASRCEKNPSLFTR